MKDLLFNTHDVVLAACIFFCLFFAVAHNFSRVFSQSSRNLLTVFFVLNAFAALDTLIFWGDAIKYAAFNLSPWLLMLFSFASFAVGPFLYWFFRSIHQPDFTLKARDYLQLLPALAVIPYLYWACLRFPLEEQHRLILELSILSDERAHFWVFLTLKKLIPVLYGIYCLAIIRRATWFTSEPVGLRHLINVHAGFVLLWFLGLATHTLGQWIPVALSDFMGIMGNYLALALLIVIWIEYTRNSAAAPLTHNFYPDPPQNIQSEDLSAQSVEIDNLSQDIQAFVQSQRPYLNPQLTLERFAGLMQLPPRQVSSAINRHFKQNFQEYINSFRVEEAKHFLQDAQCSDTIVEIAQHSGFNSKATFNRLFKNLVGVTPSEYRQGFVSGQSAGNF